MKILVYADSPTVNTGFGVVSRNIIQQLLEKTDADIEVFGINERGNHHPLRHNPRVVINPVKDLRMPRGELEFLIKISAGGYDHVFIICDLLSVLAPLDQKGTTISEAIDPLKTFYPNQKYHIYFPIDVPYPTDADLSPFEDLKFFDTLIPYTKFGATQIDKVFPYTKINMVEPMYHGVDPKEFYPLTRQQKKQLRKELFGVEDKRPIVSIVARNQWRKDIAKSIDVFKELKKLKPEAFLYIHSNPKDVGGDFRKYLEIWGLEKDKDYKVVNNLDVEQGVLVDTLNKIYNATDILLSSAHGEGFGLPYLEAMATKTAIMAPATGVEEELLPEQYVHNYTTLVYESSGQDGLPFPRLCVSDTIQVAKRMAELLDNPDLPKIKDKAYKETKVRFNWSTEVDKLVEIFTKPLPSSKNTPLPQ